MTTSEYQLSFLPWQLETARQWLAGQNRFAHAWLIHGMDGAGQREFVLAGAASLLCENPVAGLACGACQPCNWLLAGNHPDLRRIRPDAFAVEEGGEVDGDGKKQPSREIRIEQIRSLLPWFNTATHRGGWRVAVLYPAESLNTVAANSLLKILEEPPARTIFLLAAHAPDRLLPTLVSRCRRLPLPLPSQAQAVQWLQEQGVDEAAAYLSATGGAPLMALQLARAGQAVVPQCVQQFLELAPRGGPAVSLADTMRDMETGQWVDAFQRLWLDLGLAMHGLTPRYYPQCAARTDRIARMLVPAAYADTHQWLQEQKRLASHALNPGLLAEHAASRLLRPVRARA